MRTPRTTVRAAAAALALAFGLPGIFAATAGPATAAGVVATTDVVNVRTGPSTSYPIVARVPRGAAITVDCYQVGQQIGTDPAWLHTSWAGHAGFVSDWYTNTHWRTYAQLEAYGFGRCGATPTPGPTQPGIAGADQAINWMAAQMGSRRWDGLCLSAVWNAYRAAGRDIGRAPTAYAWWAARPAAQHRGDTRPPRGALVFFDGWYQGEHAGHVGIALGDGRYISSYDRTGYGIHVASLAGRSSYLGWIAP